MQRRQAEELPFHEIIRKMVSAELQIDLLKKRGRYDKRREKKECRVCCGKKCGECRGLCRREREWMGGAVICTGSCYMARQKWLERFPPQPKEEKKKVNKRRMP